MRAILLLVSLLIITASYAAGDPIAFGVRSGPPEGPSGSRDALWSQPVNVNGNYVGSEVIGEFGLEDEVADDFILPIEGRVLLTHVTWWGGEYQYVPGDPQMTSFNLLFYDEDPDPSLCQPVDTPFTEITGVQPTIETIFDGFGLALRKYDLDVDLNVPGQTRIWLVVQAADHPYPPQWARFQSLDGLECDAMFRSEWFSYPDWISVTELFGLEFPGVAFELFGNANPTPVQATSWGHIRALYR